MILRIKLPQPLFLYYPIKGPLEDVSASFTFHRYAVMLTAAGGEVEKATWAKPDDLCQWYRKATELVLTITETEQSRHPIANLITAPLHEKLLELIEGMTLQVLRVIRNVGIAPELPESLPREDSLEEELRTWGPEVSEDGVTWTPVFPPEPRRGFRSLLGGLLGPRKEGFAMNAELNVTRWDYVCEVLEDNIEIPPEDEFLTNTTGHLRGRNYRLAVVDAVIGLEMVLSRYLKAYLGVAKGLSKPRIKDFLRHDFGLTARLSGILDLTVHESYLKDINLDDVLKAVGWRNGIVHRTGQLPPEVPTEVVREVINAVLHLARMLAELHVDVLALPDRKKIGEAVRKSWSRRISWLRIWIKPWHRVEVEVECFGDTLSREEMRRIAEDLGTHLKARDPRFDPSVGLRVSYYQSFPRKYLGGYFVGLVRLKGEPLFETPPATPAGSGSKTEGPASASTDSDTTDSPTSRSASRESVS